MVPADSEIPFILLNTLSPFITGLTAIATGLIGISPMVFGFLSFANKYATSYDAF